MERAQLSNGVLGCCWIAVLQGPNLSSDQHVSSRLHVSSIHVSGGLTSRTTCNLSSWRNKIGDSSAPLFPYTKDLRLEALTFHHEDPKAPSFQAKLEDPKPHGVRPAAGQTGFAGLAWLAVGR